MLPAKSREDSYGWALTKNGKYSVKSGYDLSFKHNHKDKWWDAQQKPSISNLSESCWSLDTYPKIRTFCWKAVNGALAVEDRLKSRGIRGNMGCCFCDEEVETVNHILFLCPFSRQVWALTNLPHPKGGFCNSFFENFNHHLIERKSKRVTGESKRVFPWVLWQLWKNRNLKVFEGSWFQSEEVVNNSFEDAKAWSSVQQKEKRPGNSSKNPKLTWKPPTSTTLKCNIGSAWSTGSQDSGAAWVLRNHRGKVLLHSRRAFADIHSDLEANIKSWEWALESMASLHFSEVVFASSSSILVQAIQSPLDWPAISWQTDLIVKAINDVEWWNTIFEPNCCNKGASLIAKSVVKDDRHQSYIAIEVPLWLKSFFEL